MAQQLRHSYCSLLCCVATLACAYTVCTIGPQAAWAANDVAVNWTSLEATYNPSLVQYGDKFIAALKRTAFRRLKGKTFWVNHLYLCVGSSGGLQDLRCHTYNPWLEPYSECEFGPNVRDGKTDVTGLGDVKMWVWPGKGVYTIFGRKPERVVGEGPYCTGKVVYHQWIAQVRPEQSAGQWRLERPLRLYLSGKFQYPAGAEYIMEKNWMPWVHRAPDGRETLFVTHMVDPHRVLEVSPSGACEVRYETTGNPELFAQFAGRDVHGGPPVVWVDGKQASDGKPYYLGILHYFELLKGMRGLASTGKRSKRERKFKLYRHFAFKFEPEPPFRITAVSDELNLTFYRHRNHPTKAHIAFVAGFYLGGDGKLYISYGAGDRESRVMVMTLKEMEALFTGKLTLLPSLQARK